MTRETLTLLTLAGSYLLGSLPFGLWLVHAWKGIDIRTLGSGNIGSTNVGRVCGPVAGGVVFVLDVLKGLIPPLVAQRLGLEAHWQVLAALLAIIGHNYSVWLGFKGGKGIATSLGALIGVSPPVAGSAFAIFLLEYVTLRYVSVGSLLGAASLPIFMPVFYKNDGFRFGFALIACGMAFYKHRANIQRLKNGTEPKVRMPWIKEVSPSQTEIPDEAVVSAPPSIESTSVHG